MPAPDVLPITPFPAPVRGEARLPGSKSLTNRALLLAALAEGRTVLTGALFSEDTEIMVAALGRLGFEVRADAAAQTIAVGGHGGAIPAANRSPEAPADVECGVDLFVGLAGTAARFLTALCAAAPRGRYRLDGTEQMRRRPMKGLIDALRSLGAEIRCEGTDGFLPFVVHAHGLRAGEVALDASESSQMLSALLMVAPLAVRGASPEPAGPPSPARAEAGRGLHIRLSAPVREPFVEMTRQLMHQFGVDVASGPGVFHVPSRAYRLDAPPGPGGAKAYPIEPDATAASYFLALPLAVGGTLLLPHVNPLGPRLQGDIAFERVLRQAGLSTEPGGKGLMASFPAGGVRVPVTQDFRDFSDTFLTLAALSPLLGGTTRITGIAHTRKQETDRVEAAAAELRKIVGEDRVRTTEDSLEIDAPPLPALRGRIRRPVEIDPHGDHRLAMSFAILGCHDLQGDGRPWLVIRNPGVCAKTFPDFFGVLDSLRPAPRAAGARGP